MKSLIALSKFLGLYPQLKQKLEAYALKWERKSALEVFNSMLAKGNQDTSVWVREVMAKLPTYKDFVQFAALSGLRKEEARQSFNLIIQLSRTHRLTDYYKESTSCLEHFKYPDMFIRRTKSAYITFMPKDIVETIAKSEIVVYETLRKRFRKQGLKVKISFLRSTWATFMEKKLTQSEVDMLQGRISQSVFMRHYFSPSIQELKQRVLTAVNELEQQYQKANLQALA